MKKLFILSALFLSFLLQAEEEIIQDKAYINRSFKVYVRTMVPYSKDLDVELASEEESNIVSVSEPYLRPYNALTDIEGEIIYEDMTEIVLTFRASEGDIYQCRGLRLFREKFDLVLPDFPVIVHNRDEVNLDFPLQIYWSPVKEKAYPGEIVALILNVRYTESLDFPENIVLSKPAGGNLEQVDLHGSIETFDINDQRVYAYPLESWYFSSGEEGSLTIPGGQVSILGLARRIPPVNLEILPLPDELKRSGAVGDFSVITRLSGDKAEQGEIVTLTVRIEGTGNFHYLSFPEILAEGFELINSSDEEELIPTEAGYSGYRERIYRYQAGNESRGTLSCSSFTWYDPAGESFSSYAGDSYDVDITVKGTTEEDDLPLLTSGEIEHLIIKEILQGPFLWLMVLPGLLYFIFSLFSINDRNKGQALLVLMLPLLLSLSGDYDRKEIADRAQDLFQDADYVESLSLYRELYENEDRSAYLYNMAVIGYYMGNPVESEILFRKALMIMPGEQIFIRGLSGMEELAGLSDQYEVNWRISAGQLKWIFLLLVNFFLFVLAAYLKKRKMPLLLLMASLFFLSLGVGGGILVLNWMNERPQGIVSEEDSPLCRIPESTAEDWLFLSSGTAVRLITEKKGYYFIRTGYGLEGWIKTEHVVPTGGRVY